MPKTCKISVLTMSFSSYCSLGIFARKNKFSNSDLEFLEVKEKI
jgi:hypothetical protein